MDQKANMPEKMPQRGGPAVAPLMPNTSGLRNCDPKNVPISPASPPITEK